MCDIFNFTIGLNKAFCVIALYSKHAKIAIKCVKTIVRTCYPSNSKNFYNDPGIKYNQCYIPDCVYLFIYFTIMDFKLIDLGQAFLFKKRCPPPSLKKFIYHEGIVF